MSVIKALRLYHAFLATLSLLAYVTGEAGIIHAWLGYGVSAVILLRLLWAMGGQNQLGLSKFWPDFGIKFSGDILSHPAISRILLAGIAVSLIAVSVTGILIDRGEALGLKNASVISSAYADDDDHGGYERGEREEEGAMTEVHEFFGNLMLLFVGAHVGYLFLFRRPLALFMLFLSQPGKKSDPK